MLLLKLSLFYYFINSIIINIYYLLYDYYYSIFFVVIKVLSFSRWTFIKNYTRAIGKLKCDKILIRSYFTLEYNMDENKFDYSLQ